MGAARITARSVLAGAAVAAACLAAASGASARSISCSDVSVPGYIEIQDIVATNLGCRTARRVALRWGAYGKQTYGWRCTRPYSGGRLRCRNGRWRVSFSTFGTD